MIYITSIRNKLNKSVNRVQSVFDRIIHKNNEVRKWHANLFKESENNQIHFRF